MCKASIPFICTGLALAAAVPVAPAQDPVPATDAAALVEQVAQLNQSVQRLVRLLERQLEHREVDLVLKRIEMQERRLAPLEAELRRARSSAEGARTEHVRLQSMLDEHEQKVREEIREGTDAPQSATRNMIDEIARATDRLDMRTDQYESTVRRLEDELTDGRRQVAILDELLERLVAASESGRR